MARTIIALVGCALFASQSSHAAEEIHLRWVLAHEPINVFARAAKHFSDEVEKETHGGVKVEIVDSRTMNNGQVLKASEVVDKLTKGEIEMSQTYSVYLGTLDRKIWSLDLPFLFRNHDHAAKVLDGQIGEELLKGLDSHGLVGLGFTYSGGYRCIPTGTKEIRKVSDFKDMKIRIPPYSPVASAIITKLGAKPIPSTLSDGAPPELADGTLDGTETTMVRFWESANKKPGMVVNDTEHSLYVTAIIINKKFFDSLPENYRDAVRKAAKKAAVLEREDSIHDAERIKGELEKSGYKLVKLNGKEKARFQKDLQPVYSQFESMFGDGLVQRIRSVK